MSAEVTTVSLTELCAPYLVSPRLTVAQLEHEVDDVVRRYSEPWRHYHVVTHMGDVVQFLVENASKLRHPRPTIWAGLEHDEIYVPQAPSGVNEDLSAQAAEARATRFMSANDVARVIKGVQATTKHQWDGEDTDVAYLLDADLKILGAAPEVFDEYDHNIGLEYSFVPKEIYAPAREKVLRHFYGQDRLFVTDTGYEQFEEAAKANLERKLDELAFTQQ